MRRRVPAGFAFGLTEPDHGSDASWLETTAVLDEARGEWVIDGAKMWMSGAHSAPFAFIFARTGGRVGGKAVAVSCFVVPMDAPGVRVEEFLWTFNMPSDHAFVTLRGVRLPDDEMAVLGGLGNGLAVAQHFVHENRMRQAASGVGAAAYCIRESVRFAQMRQPFGRPLSEHQAIQFPLAELQTARLPRGATPRSTLGRKGVHIRTSLRRRDGAGDSSG